MAKATLSLSAKANNEGEHIIKVRLDITRTNRPQFKSPITIKPEHFVDGQIKIPSRSKLNASYRDCVIKKKADLEAFIAHLNAIAMALPQEARNRQDIMEVYETVKTLSPSEITKTTIVAKKREQAEANIRLVAEIQESRRPDILNYVRTRVQGMIDGTIKRKGNNYSTQTIHTYKSFAVVLESFMKEHPFSWQDLDERVIDEFVLYMETYGYMKKTINKNLAVFSAMLNYAFKDDYKFKSAVLNQFPKLQVKKEDMATEIYLTEDELQALFEMELAGEEEIVRDVFLAGCYTSQRFSDYSCINESNFSTHDGINIITLTQKKTGTEVSIPIINNNLLTILRKYDLNLPDVENNTLNEIIKVIMKRLSETVPSLRKEMVTKLTLQQRAMEEDGRKRYKRNANGDVVMPRYDLVVSHTARRTGITLMYLSRILDTHEMMSISGHKTESVFNEYIKLSGVELATNIAKKVANAKKESEVKAMLIKKLESLSVEQLTSLLEHANVTELA
ncbi:hypothetical protein C3V43_14140 [Bacteroides heparinolyticus]|uniref:tyrosine-type recombinase/integrase n=1 Tax=Prevotella heparinolytica TaxID=28113 RepID=UPI000D038269|nr:phage integrase SAM-like domain-containing protein [Bacteroides heparinolyticus]AVM58745.1 hypothetical protein C3V43_14140 [Bacteroides heparinolyticus]